jgi:DNA-binding GntR family transcriptional regulator
MSPAHVLEPTYQNLKQGLMEGNWRRGERLKALRLADEIGVSMTPVRDCLNRLVGEGLVDMQPGDG